MQRNFYRSAWAQDLMANIGMTKKEALEYVDEKMEEYYQEHVKESDE